MSQIKRYLVTDPFPDLQVTVDVDHAKLTPELADEINSFYSNHESRVSSADGDVVIAVVKHAAGILAYAMLNGASQEGAQAALDEYEGYPPHGEHGIELVDVDGLPEFDSEYFEVEEIER